jgi:hypothetical protein
MTLRQLLMSPGVLSALGIWAWYCTIAEGIYAREYCSAMFELG